MPISASDHKLWEQEQSFITKQRELHPELFVPIIKPEGTLLKRVGITAIQGERPKGFIKYSPLDFIVEEIRPSGDVIAIDGKEAQPEYEEGEGTIYADITKVGISTLDAVQRVADALHIENKQIGYAGIKDAVALTSQRISFRGVTKEVVEALRVPGCLFRNVEENKGAIGVGNLMGNRFTLFIRTEKPVDENSFSKHIQTIQQNGIMNYFGVQRFGTPRFLAHLFGMHLLRGEYKECVRVYLTKESEFELPFFTNKRREAGSQFGNWQKMKEIFSVLPYTFRFELQLIDSMISRPNELNAIHAVGQQASMWVRAYSSYLVNLVLSDAAQTGKKLPNELALMFGREQEMDPTFKPWMQKHNTINYRSFLRDLKFVQAGKNPKIEPVIYPKFHGYKILPEGMIVSFDLQKGAYATTVLEELFQVVTGYPIPEWINRVDVDSKKELGTGNLDEVKTLLAEEIKNVMSRKVEQEEEK